MSPARRSHVLMPSEVDEHVGLFDRFAGRAADFASRAPFFAGCVLLVVLWLLEGLVFVLIHGDPSHFLDDKYQLQINTTTTIVTFLLVALLQNSQTRNDAATQHKLNAVAAGVATLLEHHGHDDAVAELQHAVGLERYESTT